MIVFLNFAPFRFMGGAEKWVYEIAKVLSKKEKITLLSVDPKISNIYAQLVLNRKFDIRTKSLTTKNINDLLLTPNSFVPFTDSWSKAKKIIQQAEYIYLKYELIEVAIIVYLGGFSIFKKIIAGLHTPFIYSTPITFFDKLHNAVYSSSLSIAILKRMHKVHVINRRDYDLFTKKLSFTNATLFSNAIKLEGTKLTTKTSSKKELKVIFVGELIMRKGIDIVINTIKKSDKSIQYNIVGNGPLQKEIKELSNEQKNCTYHGYLEKKELYKLYQDADVLFLPSRAEGFPLVFHEAMAHGLQILDSQEISVGLPDDIEISIPNTKTKKYVAIINEMQKNKKNDNKLRKNIIDYYSKNISFNSIEHKLQKELFI